MIDQMSKVKLQDNLDIHRDMSKQLFAQLIQFVLKV